MNAARPIQIEGMAYAPTNELGVVFLFGRLAHRMGFQVEELHPHSFPDCIARRRGKQCRVEFEYRASSYKVHAAKGADVLVCWENDWQDLPKKYRHLEVVELKRYVKAAPRVIAVGCDEKVRGAVLDKYKRPNWSVPTYAQVGDLLVMYRKKPAMEIRDLWRITGPFFPDEKWGLQAYLHRLVRLDNPITLTMLKSDPSTRTMALVRGNCQGKRDVTDEWYPLYRKIIALNPGVKRLLREYAVG